MNKIEKKSYLEFLKRIGSAKYDKNGFLDIDMVSNPSTPNIDIK